MFSRVLLFAYALAAYVLATASLLYLMGFLINTGVPKGISDGAIRPLWQALGIDVALVLAFGLHHSVTARRTFKAWWTTIIPPPIERATYLYMTVIMITLLVYFWQPMPQTIWRVESTMVAGVIYGGYLLVWTWMVAATFHFGHFGFFGLAQAWHNLIDQPPAQSGMTARYLYALVRHPISLGWMVMPFVTPHLTLGHVVFAGATVLYIVLATPFEEADLVAEIGEPYRQYQSRVPRFLPGGVGNRGE